ncbi:MAG: hypothetical protein JRJ78_16740 [Deltaproteobacteria bacterium]|nr:hypothetical protein [Deltaproteobacteria bacterium]
MNKETIQLGEPGRRILVVSVEDLLNLLTHYTDGDVPLDAEPLFVGFNKYLGDTRELTPSPASPSPCTSGTKARKS